ncbi:MAG: methylenetetrahydrofolate reductase [NAD(P)H] [Methylobacteriaceae bacterium]|nr:methylenetetrahydrofolate reductase [NAD(P)H] [Methylobacteriaceae bacterium]
MSSKPERISRGATPALRVSFEFFPPKTAEMESALWESIQRLAPLGPHFVSVTYGAGGTTRERTHATVARLVRETTLKPAAHLTCVGATRAEINEVARAYHGAGVRHVVALRGDPPTGIDQPYIAHPQGYQSTPELITGLKAIGDFEVSVSAYPEKHPQSPTLLHDIDILKRKVDAGADRAITQFFFDNSVFYRYRDLAAAAGLTIPIVPGVVPVQNFKQTAGFARRTGASVPAWLAERFEGLENDPATRRLVAAAVCAEQVIDLIDHGVTDLHFYTMNKADLVFAICHLIGLRAQGAIEQAA